jgi:predicted membrane protein
MSEKIFKEKRNKTLSYVTVLGAACILIGLILLAFNIGWLNPAFKSIVLSWPMLLILLAVIGFAKKQRMFPAILLLLGVFFLLPRLERVYPGFLGEAGGNFTSNYWPFLLIVIGLMLIIDVATKKKKKGSDINGIDIQADTSKTEGWIEKDVIFGSSESLFLEPMLKGGDIDVVFGGIVIDLRKTTLPDTTVYLDIDAVFGGITFYVPEDWNVKSNLDSVFGGYSDKRPNVVVAEGDRKLILQGSLIFSGCTIQ